MTLKQVRHQLYLSKQRRKRLSEEYYYNCAKLKKEHLRLLRERKLLVAAEKLKKLSLGVKPTPEEYAKRAEYAARNRLRAEYAARKQSYLTKLQREHDVKV